MTLARQSQLPLPSPFGSGHLPVLPSLAALIEIAVLFTIIVGADWLHPGIDIADIRPHPFWIPVLLLSLQYGTASGLLAAGVAIAITAINGFPEQSTSETYFAYFLKIWIEPILWVGAAVLLGQFRMRQIARKQALITQITELANQHETLSNYTTKLRSYCTALERQIAGRSEPNVLLALEALNAARHSATSGQASGLDQSFARVISLTLPGARATLYVADPAGLRLVAVAGTPPGNDTGAWIASTHPLFGAVVAEARSVSVLTPEGETSLAKAGLAAVPVGTSAAHGSKIAGMLKIEEIDPASFGRATLPALEAIAHALSPALEALLSQSGRVGVASAPRTAVRPEASGPRFLRHLRWFSRVEPKDGNSATAGLAPVKARVTN